MYISLFLSPNIWISGLDGVESGSDDALPLLDLLVTGESDLGADGSKVIGTGGGHGGSVEGHDGAGNILQ